MISLENDKVVPVSLFCALPIIQFIFIVLKKSRFKHLSKSKMAESPCLWELQPLLFSKVCCTETLSRNFFDLFIQLLRLVILPV